MSRTYRVDLAALPPASKRRAWAWIRKHRPELAEFLRSETYVRLRDELGCTPILELTQQEMEGLRGQR